MPVALGIIAPFWLAPNVKTAWYLTPEQRAFGERRMIIDAVGNGKESHKMTRQGFKDAFTDWRIWAIMLSNTLASLSSQGFTIFFPVVVKVRRKPRETRGKHANARPRASVTLPALRQI